MINKKHQLLKNTFIILFGKMFTQFLSFVFLPLYTSKLSTNEYGLFDIISTYVILFSPIVTLQIEMAVFRDLLEHRNDKNEKEKIISSSFMSILQNIFIVSIFYLIFNCFYKLDFNIYIYIYTFTIILINYLLQVARGIGDNIGFSIGSVISGTINLILNIVFLFVFNIKLEGLFLSSIIANCIATVFLIVRLKLWKYLVFKNDNRNKKKELLKYSLPLVPNGLIWWVINVSDRTMITWIIGASANGIYAVANKFSSVLIQAYNVFNLSWTESASLHIGDNDDFFSETFVDIIKLFLSICIIIICIIPFVYNILIGKNFWDSYNYIPLLLIGMLFDVFVSFLGSIYIALKLTKKLAITSLISGIINVVFNLIFIKHFGIYAATFSTIIAFLTMSIYRFYDIKKYIEIKINLSKIWFLIVLLFSSLVVYYYFYGFYKVILSFSIIILVLIINFEYLKKIKIFLIKKKENI